MNIKKRVENLKKYKEAYYDENPLISDAEFDKLEDELRDIGPDNDYFKLVGGTNGKVAHKINMGSMEKLKDSSEISKWMSNFKIISSIIASPKIDGISGSIVYIDGELTYGATRGDGSKGEYIKCVGNRGIVNIPNKIDIEGRSEVRGEFYIDKKHSDYFNNRPLRNVCAGILRKSKEDVDKISFVAYRLIVGDNYHKDYIESLRLLKDMSFESTLNSSIEVTETGKVQEYFQKYENVQRDKYHFETDGIVLTVNNAILWTDKSPKPIWTRCVKPKPEGGVGSILDIEFNVSRTGNIIPVFIISPIIIAYVEYKRATGSNIQWVMDIAEGSSVPKGSEVEIIRANDVIPKVVKITPGDGEDILIDIKNCPSCNSTLRWDNNHTHKVCDNEECGGRIVSRLSAFVRKLGVKGLGRSIMEDLYGSGMVKTPSDLFKVDFDKALGNINGYIKGGSRISNARKALDAIIGKTDDISIIAAMNNSNIGRTLLIKNDIYSIDNLSDELFKRVGRHKYISDLYDEITSSDLLVKLQELKTLLKSVDYEKEDEIDGDHVVITGRFDIPRKEMIKKLNSKGFVVDKSVNKNTYLLLVGEDGQSSSKYKKAMKLGIKISRNWDKE